MKWSRYWLGSLSVPILLASAGCSIGLRPNPQAHRQMSPDRMMAIAKTFERQGRTQKAKDIYQQILEQHPEYATAREKFDSLVAHETNPVRSKFNKGRVPSNQNQMLAGKRVAPGSKLSRPSANPASQPETESRFEPVVQIQPEVRSPEEVFQPVATVTADPIITENMRVDSGLLMFDAHDGIAKSHPLQSLPASNVASEDADLQFEEPVVISEEEPEAVAEPMVIADEEPTEADRAPELLVSANPQPISEDLETDPFLPVEMPASNFTENASGETVWEDNLWVETSTPVQPERAGLSEEPIEFVQPVIQPKTVNDVELAIFFGPFAMEMVQTLKHDRDRYQTKLAKVACDEEIATEMRSRAIFLLGAVGPEANEVVPALRRLIHDDHDPFLKVDVCEAILKIQAEDEDAIRSLVSCLKDPNPQLRWIAVFALRTAVSPRTTYIIDELREVLNSDDAKLQRMVFLTLAEFGPAAVAALPEIRSALESSDSATRQVAKAAFESISQPQNAAATR